MKRIAIVGAPGSGKSDLAYEIADYLQLERGMSVEVVDKYIENWSNYTDIAPGEFATYIGNMQIAMERLNSEQATEAVLRKDEGSDDRKVLITCGTILETLVYQCFNAYCLAVKYQDGKSTERISSNIRSNVTNQWLTLLKIDSWRYDKALWISLPEEKKTEDNAVATVIDRYILEAAEALNLEINKIEKDSWKEAVDLLWQPEKVIEDTLA